MSEYRMRTNPNLALALSITLLLFPACSTYQSREEAFQYQTDMQQRIIAWYQAQSRLTRMCMGPERRSDCQKRYVKEGPMYEAHDWVWLVMPSYSTIVEVHEEELRKRTPAPPLYVEYTIGAARYLAARADRGDISPQGFKASFSKVWKWMMAQMEQHGEILARNLIQAESSDREVWQIIGRLAAELAIVLGAVALARAATPPAPPTVIVSPAPVQRRVYCQATRIGTTTNIYCF